MRNYLISFPSSALQASAEELPAVAEAAHAVVREAKAAGVWVFGGALDETQAPLRVAADGHTEPGAYPLTQHIEGGYAILRLPSREAALHWAARLAAACRCAQELRVFHEDPESLP